MSLDELMIAPADIAYYDAGFRTVLEDHLSYFRTHPTTTIQTLQASDVFVHEFDFYGLLRKMGIPPELHYVTMRLANLTSPNDSFKHLEMLLVPDLTEVNKRLQMFRATKSI